MKAATKLGEHCFGSCLEKSAEARYEQVTKVCSQLTTEELSSNFNPPGPSASRLRSRPSSAWCLQETLPLTPSSLFTSLGPAERVEEPSSARAESPCTQRPACVPLSSPHLSVQSPLSAVSALQLLLPPRQQNPSRSNRR